MRERALIHVRDTPEASIDSAMAGLRKPPARQHMAANQGRPDLEVNPFGDHEEGRPSARLPKSREETRADYAPWKRYQLRILSKLNIQEGALDSFIAKKQYLRVRFYDRDLRKTATVYAQLKGMGSYLEIDILGLGYTIIYEDVRDISVVGKTLTKSQRQKNKNYVRTVEAKYAHDDEEERAGPAKEAREAATRLKAQRRKEAIRKLLKGSLLQRLRGMLWRLFTEESWERASRQIYGEGENSTFSQRLKEIEAEERHAAEESRKNKATIAPANDVENGVDLAA